LGPAAYYSTRQAYHCWSHRDALWAIILGRVEEKLAEGFRECWRILDDYGVLIFKWNSKEKNLAGVLNLFTEVPLFGHTNNRGNAHWMCFMKIPKSPIQ
jgi:hypothetical protein